VWVAAGQQEAGAGQIVALARRLGAPVHLKSPAALSGAATTGAPQGVIAWASPVSPVALVDLLGPGASEPSRPSAGGELKGLPGPGRAPFLLVLDGVTDPGNFGALLRTAACAGVSGVVVARHRAAPLTPAALKAAAGAVERVPIALVAGIPAALQQVSRAGVWTVGLDPAGETDLWTTAVLDGPVALVLGSEGDGLAHLVRQRCDVLACIPQAGALGSLNVAAAGAVACFEVARRRATTTAGGAAPGSKGRANRPGDRRPG
jgi:23S rRNA (guanosine2251-2'-O)-methyltransferase